ncbi:MAG: potassium channel family protein [Chloroflexota bacterium]
MAKQVAVIGLGRFGSSVSRALHESGQDVLAIDNDEVRIQDISQHVTQAVQADATNEGVLRELGLENFEIAVVAMGTDVESSVLCTLLLRMLGVKYIIARADHNLHGSILERIGANRVVYPEHEMGTTVAHSVRLRNVQEYLPLTPEYGVSRFRSPQYVVGRTLSEIGFGPSKGEVAVLLIQRGDDIIISPSGNEKVEVGDALVLFGQDDVLEKLLDESKERFQKEEQQA